MFYSFTSSDSPVFWDCSLPAYVICDNITHHHVGYVWLYVWFKSHSLVSWTQCKNKTFILISKFARESDNCWATSAVGQHIDFFLQKAFFRKASIGDDFLDITSHLFKHTLYKRWSCPWYHLGFDIDWPLPIERACGWDELTPKWIKTGEQWGWKIVDYYSLEHEESKATQFK